MLLYDLKNKKTKNNAHNIIFYFNGKKLYFIVLNPGTSKK